MAYGVLNSVKEGKFAVIMTNGKVFDSYVEEADAFMVADDLSKDEDDDETNQ